MARDGNDYVMRNFNGDVVLRFNVTADGLFIIEWKPELKVPKFYSDSEAAAQLRDWLNETLSGD